ncbi:MAG TPA: hypothetical protein VN824_09505, partial [Puia sp.]|nr:hypothetical protein [Puia sp.]
MTRQYRKMLPAVLFFLIPFTRIYAQPGAIDYPGSPSLKSTAVAKTNFPSGPGAGYQKSYKFLHSANLVADKDFYWLTVLDQTPVLQNLLASDPTLRSVHDRHLSALKSHVTDSCTWPASLVTDFRFTSADSLEIATALTTLYRSNKTPFDAMVDQHLRPSGYYQRFIAGTNEQLLLQAWGQTFIGINYIIDQFGLGKKMRYPLIDSASYDVNSRYYRTVLKDLFAYLSEQENSLPT